MTDREAPNAVDKIGWLSRRALLGSAGVLLFKGLTEPADRASDPGGSKEKHGPSELPMMQGELSQALEQYKSPEEIARNGTYLLLDLFHRNGGFDPQSERCYVKHCGARVYKVPPAKIYDRDPDLYSMQSSAVYDSGYNPDNGQLHLYVTHDAHKRRDTSRPSPRRPEVQAATNGPDDDEEGISNNTHATLEAHFDPPEGSLKADGTIDLGEIAQAIKEGHPVTEMYGTYVSQVADIKVGVAYNRGRDEWTQSVRDLLGGGALRYYRSSDLEVDPLAQRDVPLWFGAILDTVERDVRLASPIQHA